MKKRKIILITLTLISISALIAGISLAEVTIEYTYDDLNRLKAADYLTSPQRSIKFEHDEVNNITEKETTRYRIAEIISPMPGTKIKKSLKNILEVGIMPCILKVLNCPVMHLGDQMEWLYRMHLVIVGHVIFMGLLPLMS